MRIFARDFVGIGTAVRTWCTIAILQIPRSLLKWEYHATLLQVGLCLIESSGGSSMRLLPIHRLLSILLLEVSISGLSAQTTTSGGLAGVVTDPSNAVVPNAKVEIKDDAKGTTQSTKTDQQGVYRFLFLAPSRYTLSVTGNGFQEEDRTVVVRLGPPVSVNVSLRVAQVRASVTVTSEAPLIHAENGDVSSTMSEVQISEVPNPGNDLTYIGQTAPGAIMNTDMALAINGGFVIFGGNFSILGMPGTSNLFTLNGMNDNDNGTHLNYSGATNLLLGQNQVQEATVVSNGYSGQFGGAAGANVNYITKSGSNTFHGNAEYFWNGRVFNANDWINKALGYPRPFDIANQWAGSFGGPIQKDKLFFFFDTEGLRILLPVALQVVLPSPEFESATIANIDSLFGATSASDAFYKRIFKLYDGTPGIGRAIRGNFSDTFGCQGFVGPNGLGQTAWCTIHFQKTVGQPTDESILSGRVDWNITGNDRAFLLVQHDHSHQVTVTDPVSPLFNVYSDDPWWQGQLHETHTFGPTAANQFLLAGTYLGFRSGVANTAEALAAFPTVLNWFTTGTGLATLGGYDYIYAFPIGQNITRYQVSDDFVKTTGSHKFGFGANLVRTYWTTFGTTNVVGDLVPQTLQAFYSGGVDPSSSNTNFTTLLQSFPSARSQRLAFYNLGLYAEEEWHARSNLNFSLALRADHQSNPTCARRCFARLAGPFESISHDPAQPYNQAILTNQKQALEGTDKIVWAPRFSFAWQPFGVSHLVVIRGGVGIFYDPFPDNVGASFAANPPLVNAFAIQGYNLTPDEGNSLFKVASSSNAGFVNGFASGQTLAQIQKSDPFFFPPSISVPNAKTHSPQYQKWSLEVQRAFGTSTSVSVGYYGNHGIHELVQNPSANAFGFGPFPSSLCTSPPVPPCADPRFSQVTENTTAGISNYNGMVVSFQRRISHWGSGLFQANYTYGHALDEVSNGGLPFVQFGFGSSTYPQDPYNLRGSYGAADYDVRHSFNANYVWQVPVKAMLHGHGADYLVNGWQISGTVFARTGFPYTVIDFAETNNLVSNNFVAWIYAVPVRPLGPGASCGEGAAIPLAPHPCQPPQMLGGAPNPNALYVQTGCETGFNTGHLGPSGSCNGPVVSFAQGRNRFRYPSYFNTDFTIMKNTKIPGWEKAVLGIGFQFFNFFNHPNFGPPDNFSSDATFGQIVSMEMPPTSILGSGLGGAVSPRMIQLKAQLQF